MANDKKCNARASMYSSSVSLSPRPPFYNQNSLGPILKNLPARFSLVDNKLAIMAFASLLFILLIGFASAEPISPTTDRVCNGNICTLNIYSNSKYVLQDGAYIPVEQARSLKNSGIYEPQFLEIDPNYNVTIEDFNLTSITFNITSSSDAPITIWQPDTPNFNLSNYKDLSTSMLSNVIQAPIGRGIGSPIDNQPTDIIPTEQTIDFSPGQLLEVGTASTVVIINSVNPQDVGFVDSRRNSSALGNPTFFSVAISPTELNRTYLKFNISSLNAQSILTANLQLSIFNLNSNSSLSVYHVYQNASWNQSNITWNNQPCGINFNNATACNLNPVNITLRFVGSGGKTFNVTSALLEEPYLDSVSFVLTNANESNLNNISNLYFSNIGTNTELSVTYTYNDTTPPILKVTSPTATTYLTTSVIINFSASDNTLNGSLWFYNETANVSYTTPISYTLSNGTHQFIFYANDTSGNIANITIDFTVNLDVEPPDSQTKIIMKLMVGLLSLCVLGGGLLAIKSFYDDGELTPQRLIGVFTVVTLSILFLNIIAQAVLNSSA